MSKQVRNATRKFEDELGSNVDPLILELLRAGIKVFLCEEAFKSRELVAFVTARDAEKFLNIVSENPDFDDPQSLYSRINAFCSGVKGAWQYRGFEEDRGLKEHEDERGNITEKHGGKPDWVFRVAVNFPRSDYPEVLARMKKHNARNKTKRSPKKRRR